MDDSQEAPAAPAFGLAFRIIVGCVALLCAAVLGLWASDQGAAWKFLPALFCLCVFGIVALPRPLAIACGYFVASTLLALCGWFLYLGFTGEEPLLNALRAGAAYGLPSLAFIIYDSFLVPLEGRDA